MNYIQKTLFSLLFINQILFAQTKELKIYPFKSAIIKYELSGDYKGEKTLYIDDYGNKSVAIIKGSYKNNNTINFEYKEIVINGLKYSFFPSDYICNVMANEYNAYYTKTQNINTDLDSILAKMNFVKTGKTKKINKKQCYEYKQHIHFLNLKYDNVLYTDKNNVTEMMKTPFCQATEALNKKYVETLKSIKTNVDIDKSLFNFPNYYLYQFVNNQDFNGRNVEKLLFSEDELKEIEKHLKEISYNINNFVNKDEFYKTAKFQSKNIFKNISETSTFSSDNSYSLDVILGMQNNEDEDYDEDKDTIITITVNRPVTNTSILKEFKSDNQFKDKKLYEDEIISINNNKVLYVKYAPLEFSGEEQSKRSFLHYIKPDKYSIKIETNKDVPKEYMINIIKQFDFSKI